MTKAVIFDLWYTLVHLPDGWETFNFLKREFNIDPNFWRTKVKDLFLCKHQENEGSFLKDFVDLTGINLDSKKYSLEMSSKRQNDLRSFRVYPSTFPILSYLKQKGFAIGIVSNQCSFYEQIYQDSGIPSLVNLGVFSNRIGIRKPNPRIYTTAANQLGVSHSDVFMVGDNIEQDYIAPTKLGMRAMHLCRGGEINPSFQIRSLEELINYL